MINPAAVAAAAAAARHPVSKYFSDFCANIFSVIANKYLMDCNEN